jgi:hypothetical protein
MRGLTPHPKIFSAIDMNFMNFVNFMSELLEKTYELYVLSKLRGSSMMKTTQGFSSIQWT